MNGLDDQAFDDAYAAFTGGCGLVPLTGWTTVSIAGEDRTSFLHNMCTNDIRRLTAGEGCEALCVDVKGKLVAHLFIMVLPDQLVVTAAPGQAIQILGHLERYVVREDVRLQDETERFDWLVISGARAPQALQAMSRGVSLQLDKRWQNAGVGAPAGRDGQLLVRFAPLRTTSYLLRVARNEQPAVVEELATAGVVACPDAVWHAVRLESGLPLLGVDFDRTTLPQEVNRDRQAISFTKGCYLGQETIARIDALGHVNKKLVRLRFSTARTIPRPGNVLRVGGEKVGIATSTCWSPQLKAPLALAMIRRGHNQPGCELESDSGQACVVREAD